MKIKEWLLGHIGNSGREIIPDSEESASKRKETAFTAMIESFVHHTKAGKALWIASFIVVAGTIAALFVMGLIEVWRVMA